MLENQFLKNQYISIFGDTDTVKVSFCPYRICPLGAHSVHQHGYISGFAINYGIYVAYTINDNALCKCASYNFEGIKSFKVNQALDKENDWADYIRGVIYAMAQNGYTLKYGINAYIHGEIPTGGLSSSAAVIISFMKALAFANDIELTNQQLFDLSYIGETQFVGMNIGKMDQSCEVLSEANKLLVLDTQSFEYENVPMEKPSKPFDFVVIHTGAKRNLAGTLFNVRVDEMRAAAFVTLSYENANKSKFNNTYLRDVPKEMYLKHRDQLPTNLRKRADHYYTEFERVLKGKELWRKGDIEGFGKLVFESGKSSIVNYESGSDVLIDLYKIISSTDGVYGGRFLGGGFNGACLAIINSNIRERIIKSIIKKYEEEHPEYANDIKVFLCKSVNGVGNRC